MLHNETINPSRENIYVGRGVFFVMKNQIPWPAKVLSIKNYAQNTIFHLCLYGTSYQVFATRDRIIVKTEKLEHLNIDRLSISKIKEYKEALLKGLSSQSFRIRKIKQNYKNPPPKDSFRKICNMILITIDCHNMDSQPYCYLSLQQKVRKPEIGENKYELIWELQLQLNKENHERKMKQRQLLKKQRLDQKDEEKKVGTSKKHKLAKSKSQERKPPRPTPKVKSLMLCSSLTEIKNEICKQITLLKKVLRKKIKIIYFLNIYKVIQHKKKINFQDLIHLTESILQNLLICVQKSSEAENQTTLKFIFQILRNILNSDLIPKDQLFRSTIVGNAILLLKKIDREIEYNRISLNKIFYLYIMLQEWTSVWYKLLPSSIDSWSSFQLEEYNVVELKGQSVELSNQPVEIQQQAIELRGQPAELQRQHVKLQRQYVESQRQSAELQGKSVKLREQPVELQGKFDDDFDY